MRSDRDKRTDSEREIDDFLSKFEDPADELSADYSSYLEESDTTKSTAAQTFYWKDIDSPEHAKVQSEDHSSVEPSAENDSPEKEGSHSKEAEKASEAAPAKKRVKKKKRSGKSKKAASALSAPAEAAADTAETSASAASDTAASAEETKASGSDTKAEEGSSSDNKAENKPASKSNKKKSKGKKKKKKKAVKKPKIDRTELKYRLFYKKNKDYDPEKALLMSKTERRSKTANTVSALPSCSEISLLSVLYLSRPDSSTSFR